MMLKCRGIGNCTLLELKLQRNRIVTSVRNLLHLFVRTAYVGAVCCSCTMNCGVKEFLIGTKCPHVPHSARSCHSVALHLFDQGTLLRRLAPYCMYSTVCALAPWGGISDQQHCTESPVLLTSCGSPEVDATGSVSAFLYTLCGLWRRCVFFQHARSVQFQIKLLLSLRLQLEYNHVTSNYNCITMTVILCWCVHASYSIIYENTEPKFSN